MAYTAEVRAGQVWKSLDKRRDYSITILSVSGGVAACQNTKTGKKTFVRLSRIRPIHNGFRLVTDAAPETSEQKGVQA